MNLYVGKHLKASNQRKKKMNMGENKSQVEADLANTGSPDTVVLGQTHTAQYKLCGISATKHILIGCLANDS